MVKDLDWNDPSLMNTDVSPILYQTNVSLSMLLEKKLQAEMYDKEAGNDEDLQKYLRSVNEMIEFCERDLDTLRRIEAMQKLFRENHMNPKCEDEVEAERSPYRGRRDIDPMVLMAENLKRLGLDKGGQR